MQFPSQNPAHIYGLELRTVETDAGRRFRVYRRVLRTDNNPDKCPFRNLSLSLSLSHYSVRAVCELWTHAQDRLVSFLSSAAHFPVALLNTRRPLTFRKGQPQYTPRRHTDRLIKLRLERTPNPQILCSERRPLRVRAILSQIRV